MYANITDRAAQLFDFTKHKAMSHMMYEKKQFAKYFFLIDQNDQYHYIESTRTGHNYDPSKGMLYATYEAVLGENEFIDYRFIRVGFACEQTTAGRSVGSTIDKTKRQGEKLVLTGTLFMSVTGENVSLCAGENPLAHMILGDGQLINPEYAVGDNYVMNAVYHREYSFLEKATTSTARGGDYMRFVCNSTLNPREAVVCVDSRPMMRAVPPLKTTLVNTTVSAVKNGVVTIDSYRHIKDVNNIKRNGVALADTYLAPVPHKMYFEREWGVSLGQNAKIVSEYYGNYFASISSGRITFFTFKNGIYKPYYHTYGSDARVFGDGSCVVFDYGTVRFIKDNEVKLSLPFDTSAPYEVIWGSNRYTLLLGGSNLKAYNIETDFSYAITVLKTGLSAAVQLFLLSNNKIGVMSSEFSPLAVGIYAQVDDELSQQLSQSAPLFTNYLDKEIAYELNKLIGYDQSGTRFCELGSNTAQTQQRVGRAYDSLFAQISEGKTKLYLFDTVLESTPLCEIDGQASHIKLCGKRAYIFLTSGRVVSYLIEELAVNIYSKQIKAGDTITGQISRQSDSYTTANLIVTFTL